MRHIVIITPGDDYRRCTRCRKFAVLGVFDCHNARVRRCCLHLKATEVKSTVFDLVADVALTGAKIVGAPATVAPSGSSITDGVVLLVLFSTIL